jgi:hypothetical protein
MLMNALHILTFGNSITAGWTRGIYPHPYAIKLLEHLEKALPSTNVIIDIQGLPGDQVVSPPGGFVPRMDILCKLLLLVEFTLPSFVCLYICLSLHIHELRQWAPDPAPTLQAPLELTPSDEAHKVPYDWAIILGGTNDFGQNRKADIIWEFLQKTYSFPLKAGTKILALTVPDQGIDDPQRDTQRNKLNQNILKHDVNNL